MSHQIAAVSELNGQITSGVMGKQHAGSKPTTWKLCPVLRDTWLWMRCAGDSIFERAGARAAGTARAARHYF